MKTFKNYLLEEEQANETPSVGDVFEIEIARDETLIETTVVEVLEDGIVINTDDTVMKMFEDAGYLQEYWTGMDSVALGGNKSPVGSRSPMKPKFNEQQDEMAKDEEEQESDIKDEQELDEMSAMRRLAGMMQDKENVKTTRIPSPAKRRIQVDLLDLTDEEFEAKHKMSKAQAREQFDEDMDEMSEPTQDAFEELKDYAETSGGIDKEEFEKAAYLVKAMGKSHLKDKAEGMLDELIGSMDSDPRDKVIQVLARHIDLTFLKNLLNEAEFTDKQIKMAYGVLNDPRYKGGNLTGATKAIEKIAQGLSKHPGVMRAIRATSEQVIVKEPNIKEAEYQGRTVKLNKPTRGDVKKFKVYVKDPKTGNVKKVNFGHGGTSAKKAGQKTMKIKKSNPARRKSFRARHNCDNPGPKTKARYWSCRAW
jgi:hypothetical protein